MQHPNRGLYLKLILLSISVFLLFQGANRWQAGPPIEPADIIILVDRSKSLDFVSDDVIEAVEFTLRYLETFNQGGNNFRVAIIPFGGATKPGASLEALNPGFWKNFDHRFGPDLLNTDFSRAFCQLQRTIANQQVTKNERQTIVLLFSDGKSEPFKDTPARDLMMQECFPSLQVPSNGYKSAEVDVEFAASIFKDIVKNNVAPKPPVLYTVIYKTSQRIDQEKTLGDSRDTWWQISANYLAYCVEESLDTGDCAKVGEKSQLLDFLNEFLVSKLLGAHGAPFQKSSETITEIRARAYTMELRVSVLRNHEDIRLVDAAGREQSPFRDTGPDFSIYRIMIPPDGPGRSWRLTMPISSDYRVDYLEPMLRFALPAHIAWAGHAFEVHIEMPPSAPGAERLPEEMVVKLVDSAKRPVPGSETTLMRQGRTRWTGVLHTRNEAAPGPYSIHLADSELERLVLPSEHERAVEVHRPAQLGDLQTHYDPKTESWNLVVPILNAENLPVNPVIRAKSVLVGGNTPEKQTDALIDIENRKATLHLLANQFPAGVYHFDLTLNQGMLDGSILTPEIYKSFPVTLYIIPSIENVDVDEVNRRVDLSLSNYFPYENLYAEFVNFNGETRRSENLSCIPHNGGADCSGEVVFFLKDINSTYSFTKITLKGKLASGNEVFLAESPEVGTFSVIPPGVVFGPILGSLLNIIAVISPVIIMVIATIINITVVLLPVGIGIVIGIIVLYWARFTPREIVKHAQARIDNESSKNIAQRTPKHIIYGQDFFPSTIIPIKFYSDILTKVANLEAWMGQKLANPTKSDLEDFKAIEKAIDLVPHEDGSDQLEKAYKDRFQNALLNHSQLRDVMILMNKTKFRIENQSKFLERAKWIAKIVRDNNNGIRNRAAAANLPNLRKISRIYDFLLGTPNQLITPADWQLGIQLDPLIDNLNNQINREMKIAIKNVNVETFDDKMHSKTIVDFELPPNLLQILDINTRISPTVFCLSAPDSIKNSSKIFCVENFEQAQGLNTYNWDAPLWGTQFRLITENPDLNDLAKIKLEIPNLNKSVAIPLNVASFGIREATWFEDCVMNNVWGVNFNPALSIVISDPALPATIPSKPDCNMQPYNKCQKIIANWINNPSHQNILRLGGWVVLSDMNHINQDTLAVFQNMLFDIQQATNTFPLDYQGRRADDNYRIHPDSDYYYYAISKEDLQSTLLVRNLSKRIIEITLYEEHYLAPIPLITILQRFRLINEQAGILQ